MDQRRAFVNEVTALRVLQNAWYVFAARTIKNNRTPGSLRRADW